MLPPPPNALDTPETPEAADDRLRLRTFTGLLWSDCDCIVAEIGDMIGVGDTCFDDCERGRECGVVATDAACAACAMACATAWA